MLGKAEQLSSINKLFNSVIDDFKLTLDSSEIAVSLNYAVSERITLGVDEKVFHTLIVALVKSSITVLERNSTLEIEVTNNADLNRIQSKFIGNNLNPQDSEVEGFPNLASNPTPNMGDLDINLALTKMMVETLGGELKTADANGGLFSIVMTLPAYQLPAISSEEDLGDSSVLTKDQNNTILIVEDQEEMLSYLEELLSTKYNVLTSANGKEAWETLIHLHTPVDLIITDLMMPEMNGFELLEKVRSDEKLLATPAIFLTAKKGDQSIVRALSVGVSDYITKPFTEEVLFAHCTHLLDAAANRADDAEEESMQNPQLSEIQSSIKFVDLEWLKKVEKVFHAHMNNKYFNMLILADELAISERQMRRKLKKITGMSPVQYMNDIKLANARKMIEMAQFETISEVSYAAGFETPSYFSIKFRQRYGVNPSDLF